MVQTVLHAYIEEVEEYYQKGIATEHTYRETLQHLLEKLVVGVRATNEPKRIKCGAPDYVVERNNLTIGYVEAKDVGSHLDTVEKNEQLKRYLHALDNLILTDYLEFRWYVQGEKRMAARIGGIRNKKIILDKDGAKLGEELLHCFLEHRGEPIRKPQELAERMARLAHLIHDIIVDTFRKEVVSATILDLYAAFKDHLLRDLTESAFADMFAQTIAYGLFAARYNHKGKQPFRREDAAKEIPRTNPFLRKLFGTIVGPDLDDEPFVGFVDELAQILAFTDMDAVLADFGKRIRRQDPIVHFYETFLAQYDSKLRKVRGVYYTPEPVVSYIVRSVDHLLRERFDCPDGLADTTTDRSTTIDENGKEKEKSDPRVLILDPATGTGTFLYNVIEHIRETYRKTGNAGMWSAYVSEHLLPRLFGLELFIAPYAMAHLKLGMQLAGLDLPETERNAWAYDVTTDQRLRIYLTNTLDEAFKRSEFLFGRYISEEANEAASVKQNFRVMVVLGNPPYSYESANTGAWINSLIREYYHVDGQPLSERNPKGLLDDYVKFIRFGQWRIERTGYGILAFITNHGYLDNLTFRGMRQSLMRTFDDIYVLDLHGNSNKKERAPDGSKDENIFDIQQGVAIGIFIKRRKKTGVEGLANVYHAHLWGPREVYEQVGPEQRLVRGKYHWLLEHDQNSTEWTQIEPQKPYYLFIPQKRDTLKEYEQYWKVTDIFSVRNVGLYTARDELAIQWTAEDVERVINDFSTISEEEAREKYHLGVDTRDWRVLLAQKDIQTSGRASSNITPILYRPFDVRYTYYTGKSRGFICMPRGDLMRHMLAGKNMGLITTRLTKDQWDAFVTTHIVGHKAVSSYDSNTLFPLYFYPSFINESLFDEDPATHESHERKPNLSPAFIQDLTAKLCMRLTSGGKGNLQQTLGPEDFFSYMYALFYSPTYRERYGEFLKIDFPRLPLTSNPALFRRLCALGSRLVELHLMEKTGEIRTRYPVPGNHMIEKVEFNCLADEQTRVWINKTQYFEGVPFDVWEFRIGGYLVCQRWLKDRKGRQLSYNDIKQYHHIVATLAETILLMEQIEEAIDEHGGWPIE